MTASNTYGKQVVVPLTNKSGGGVVLGDVVIIDTANNDAFTTTTSAAVTQIVGVAAETIASNAVGRVVTGGYISLVNVNASVTRGHYGATHTVAKQATDAGASRTTGTFCEFLTGGTTPDAMIYNTDLQAAAASGSITASGYTQSTARLLGRTTASTGAIEEITVGAGLSLSAGSLTATGGGITQTYYGYNSIGASFETATTRRIYTKTFTLAAGATVNGIDLYLKWVADNIAQFYVGIWEDNAGVPRNLLSMAYSGVANISGLSGTADRARWFSVPMGIYLATGTYWMGFTFDQASSMPASIAYDTSGSDRYFNNNGDGLTDGDTFSQTDSTRKYSMRLSAIA